MIETRESTVYCFYDMDIKSEGGKYYIEDQLGESSPLSTKRYWTEIPKYIYDSAMTAICETRKIKRYLRDRKEIRQ